MRALFLAPLILAAGCAHTRDRPAEPQVEAPPVPAIIGPGAPGPRQTYRGRFMVGFEISSFDGCWLDQGRYWGTFDVPPKGSGGVATYEIEFVGRRTDMIVPPGMELRFQGFGHMNRHKCQYEVIELVSKQRVQ